jgi:hypothetical protein
MSEEFPLTVDMILNVLEVSDHSDIGVLVLFVTYYER